MVKDIYPGHDGSNPDIPDERRAARCSSRPTTASTATSSGRATAPRPAPCWSRTSISAPAAPSPTYLTNVNGTLFFTADDGTNGTELWKSDGTEAGTVMVKDIDRGPTPGPHRTLTERQRHAVLRCGRRHQRHGAVEERRHRARHRDGQGHHPGPGGLVPPAPHRRQRHACSSRATDGTNGVELWKSDGTGGGHRPGKGHRTATAGSDPRLTGTNVNGDVRSSRPTTAPRGWSCGGAMAPRPAPCW